MTLVPFILPTVSQYRIFTVSVKEFETPVTQVSHVQQIRGAKVPIVKFMHVPSGLSCDVSFKNLMSVMNTSFIELSQVRRNWLSRTILYS